MSYSTQQLRKTCTTHTHKPRIGQSISIDAANLSLCFSLQSQPIPHKHTLQLHWPLHTQSPKRSTTKSSCSVPTLQNPLQEIFVPPPWQPPTVIDHHKTTHGQVSGACICHLTLVTFEKQFCSLLFQCIPKNHYKLLCHFFALILKT